MPLESVSVVTTLGTMATTVFGWIGDAVTVIIENEYLLLGSAFFVVGGAVSLVKKILS